MAAVAAVTAAAVAVVIAACSTAAFAAATASNAAALCRMFVKSGHKISFERCRRTTCTGFNPRQKPHTGLCKRCGTLIAPVLLVRNGLCTQRAFQFERDRKEGEEDDEQESEPNQRAHRHGDFEKRYGDGLWQRVHSGECEIVRRGIGKNGRLRM